MKAQWGSRRIALFFLQPRRLDGDGWLTPRHSREGESLPTAQEAGGAPEPVQTGAEHLVSTGIRSPDRLAHITLFTVKYY